MELPYDILIELAKCHCSVYAVIMRCNTTLYAWLNKPHQLRQVFKITHTYIWRKYDWRSLSCGAFKVKRAIYKYRYLNWHTMAFNNRVYVSYHRALRQIIVLFWATGRQRIYKFYPMGRGCEIVETLYYEGNVLHKTTIAPTYGVGFEATVNYYTSFGTPAVLHVISKNSWAGPFSN